MIKSLFLGGMVLLAAQCSKEAQKSNTDFVNQPAKIKVVVATRGAYQYLIEVNDPAPRLLAPDSPLEDAFKKDGTAVVFDGIQLPDSVWIYVPAPNDVPVEGFKAPKVKIGKMSKE